MGGECRGKCVFRARYIRYRIRGKQKRWNWWQSGRPPVTMVNTHHGIFTTIPDLQRIWVYLSGPWSHRLATHVFSEVGRSTTHLQYSPFSTVVFWICLVMGTPASSRRHKVSYLNPGSGITLVEEKEVISFTNSKCDSHVQNTFIAATRLVFE